MKNRDNTLDLAKGVLIMLVVCGHAIQFSFGTNYTLSGLFYDNLIFKAIYSFHMPLFMLISGYLFYSSNKKRFVPLAYSKLRSIGIPMLSFILVCNLPGHVHLIRSGNLMGFVVGFFETIIWGAVMWFLFSLLLNMTIVAVVTRAVGNRTLQYALMVAVFVGSLFIPDSTVLDVHKFMFPFFCIGYFIRENSIAIYSCAKNKAILGLLSILSVAAIMWFDRETYIYTTGFCIVGDYSHQLFINGKRMAIALLLSYTFMQYMYIFSSQSIGKVYHLCIRLGQISLFVYGLNIFVDIYYPKILSIFAVEFDFNYVVPLLYAACLIIMSLYAYQLLDRNKVTRLMLLGK